MYQSTKPGMSLDSNPTKSNSFAVYGERRFIPERSLLWSKAWLNYKAKPHITQQKQAWNFKTFRFIDSNNLLYVVKQWLYQSCGWDCVSQSLLGRRLTEEGGHWRPRDYGWDRETEEENSAAVCVWVYVTGTFLWEEEIEEQQISVEGGSLWPEGRESRDKSGCICWGQIWFENKERSQ